MATKIKSPVANGYLLRNLTSIIVSNYLDENAAPDQDTTIDHASNILADPDQETAVHHASNMNASPGYDTTIIADSASNMPAPNQDTSDQVIDPTDLPPFNLRNWLIEQPEIVEGLFVI